MRRLGDLLVGQLDDSGIAFLWGFGVLASKPREVWLELRYSEEDPLVVVTPFGCSEWRRKLVGGIPIRQVEADRRRLEQHRVAFDQNRDMAEGVQLKQLRWLV